MTFLGILVFYDPPKPGAAETILELRRLGVLLKIITGDNRLVATSIGNSVGLPAARMLTGRELTHMSDEALRQRANDVDIYTEVEPNQKERILLALKKQGNVVGYMGDGVNHDTALHAADVSISVEGAVDVAKEAADIVLLEKDLGAVVRGVGDGRKTFANTLRYVFMATSANFGSMFSMAGASLFLPFLPLLREQILLTNLLTALPEMTIASDSVDPEAVDRPRRWDIRFIRKFMLTFGLISSVFDYLMVFEMTLDYELVQPLLLAAAVSSLVARCFSAKSVYTEAERLPDIENDASRRLVGTVSQRDILGIYNLEVLHRRTLVTRFESRDDHAAAKYVELPAEHQIDEIPVPAAAVGMTVGEAHFRERYGASILLVHHHDSSGRESHILPAPTTVLGPHDRLVVLGPRDRLLILRGEIQPEARA